MGDFHFAWRKLSSFQQIESLVEKFRFTTANLRERNFPFFFKKQDEEISDMKGTNLLIDGSSIFTFLWKFG